MTHTLIPSKLARLFGRLDTLSNSVRSITPSPLKSSVSKRTSASAKLKPKLGAADNTCVLSQKKRRVLS